MALDDLHGLLQKSHHNPCTFTSRCVNKCFGNKTFVSIPRGFFAILLSHDDFFYQEALTMMQSEAVMHVPMPGYRKHAFLPERNVRTGRGTPPNDLQFNLGRACCCRSEIMRFNNNVGAGSALPLGARPILRKCGQTLRKCRPKIPPPGDAWLVPRISMHGACTNYPCASNS